MIKSNMVKSITMTLLVLGLILMTGCKKAEEVVIYTAVEQVHCEELFKSFEEQTGIKVKAVYDTEANKTTGLVNRIISEADRPVCDVFWNNEFIQTIKLQQEDLLQEYVAQNSKDIPEAYKDTKGYWTAFGGRARVMLVNSELLKPEQYPDSIFDLLDERYKGEDLAIAYPVFGTTKTQSAALYAQLGSEKAKEFYQKIAEKGVQIVDGNSVSKDMVSAGQVLIGLTDTDDAKEAIESGAPVKIIYPDQQEGGMGTLITPSTVAMIKNAPHEENAKKLIEYLLEPQTEEELIQKGFFDVSVRESNNLEFNVKGMSLNLSEIYSKLDEATLDMENIFMK